MEFILASFFHGKSFLLFHLRNRKKNMELEKIEFVYLNNWPKKKLFSRFGLLPISSLENNFGFSKFTKQLKSI